MRELSEHDKQLIIDSIPESNLVLFCTGIQGHGDALLDRSKSPYTVSLVGTSWSRTPRGHREIVLGGAADLVVTNFVGQPAALTFLVWVKRSDTDAGEHYIVGRWAGDIYFAVSGNVLTGYFRSLVTGVIGPTVGTTVLTDGKYHLCGYRYDGAHLSVLVDGVVEGTPAAGTGLSVEGVSDVDIGSNRLFNPAAPGYLTAKIALPIMFWDRALSDAECLRVTTRQRSLVGG